MGKQNQAPGCRDAALATGFLLGLGIALFAVGLSLVTQETCTGLCETLGLTALYAGGPVSAAVGVLTDSLLVAWPLDVTLWVVLGFSVARWAQNHGRGVMGVALIVLILALGYGLALSLLVEVAV